MTKHTLVDTNSFKGEVILSDRFITQPTSDVHYNLLKLAANHDNNHLELDDHLREAAQVFYNKKKEI